MQIDEERSDQFNTYYTKLNIIPGIDEIVINDDEDNFLLRIEEDGDNSNVMSARDADDEGESRYDFVTTGVVHVSDKVIEK